MKFKNPKLRKDCCSGDPDKLKNVKYPMSNPNFADLTMTVSKNIINKKSRSSEKLFSNI